MTSIPHTRRPLSSAVLSADSADVYFNNAEDILEAENLDPVVAMEVFARRDAVLCGIDEAKSLLAKVLADAAVDDARVEALADGDVISPKEVVLRIRARYRAFGLYETAILGMMAQIDGLGDGRPASASTRQRRSRSSVSARATSTRTSATRSTTRPSSAAASARRRPPVRDWPAWRQPARCPIRWCSSLATRSRRREAFDRHMPR